MRGATTAMWDHGGNGSYFNPRPTCVGRPKGGDEDAKEPETSIHAPHAWGDRFRQINQLIVGNTSIHAPHAWGDFIVTIARSIARLLQSTPHMRGATLWTDEDGTEYKTSIHAPHAWGDLKRPMERL